MATDSRIVAAIVKHAPDASPATVEALAAAVENEMMAALWSRMHGVWGEQTSTGCAVVEHVAARVWTDVRSNAQQKAVK